VTPYILFRTHPAVAVVRSGNAGESLTFNTGGDLLRSQLVWLAKWLRDSGAKVGLQVPEEAWPVFDRHDDLPRHDTLSGISQPT
jgi:hypothetical protein